MHEVFVCIQWMDDYGMLPVVFCFCGVAQVLQYLIAIGISHII